MKFSDLVDRISGEAADAWALHAEASLAASTDPSVILLSVGDSDLDTPQPIIDRLIESVTSGRTHYANTVGEQSLRESIAAYYQAKGFAQVKANNVVVMPGTQSGLFASAMCTLSHGDEVIIPEPMYVTYPGFIGATGASIVPVSLNADLDFALHVEDIANAISPKTKAIVLNSPNNPTGAVIDFDTFCAIAGLCKEHDLWLISDEVYLELYFDAEPTSALAFPDIADRVVVTSSLSKSHAMTGWRLGWIIAPEPLVKHLYNLLTAMIYGAPIFIQDAAVTAFEDQSIARNMRTIFKARRDAFCEKLNSLPLVSCKAPAGGMFAMLDIRKTGLSANEFARQFYDAQKVSLLSADAFGPSAKGHLRIGLTLNEDLLNEAANRLECFLVGLQK